MASGDGIWKRLDDLTRLKRLKVIAPEEFEQRKRQLVDELTGTQVRGAAGDAAPGTRVEPVPTIEMIRDTDPKPPHSKAPAIPIPSRRQRIKEDKSQSPGTPAGALPHLMDPKQESMARAAGERTLQALSEEDKLGSLRNQWLHRPPPDFRRIPSQKAQILEFNLTKGNWRHAEIVRIKIDPKPFARGNLRVAHHMLGALRRREESSEGKARAGDRARHYVVKIAIDPFDDPKSYLDDVATQIYARQYAEKYNSYNPPKKVDFVKAFVVQLLDHPKRPVCAVERYIDGTYKKHNNNWGFINAQHERNTPHAFSHFSYEASRRRVLICDIQGVGDLYTDPQVHSIDGEGFGKGNMGQRGFQKFFSTHRCNAICKFFKLPLVNPKNVAKDLCTVPAAAVMGKQRVEEILVPYQGSFSEVPKLPALNYIAPFKTNSSIASPVLCASVGNSKEAGLPMCCPAKCILM